MTKLKFLSLTLCTYGVNENRYTGELSFMNEYGEIKLNLDPDTSDKVLKVISNQLISSAKTIGANLTTACIEDVVKNKALDSPTVPEYAVPTGEKI